MQIIKGANIMRTTFTLDDDLFMAVKGLASAQKRKMSDVFCSLIRQALAPKAAAPASVRNGVPLLPVRSDAGLVTPELVNQLRDELP